MSQHTNGHGGQQGEPSATPRSYIPQPCNGLNRPKALGSNKTNKQVLIGWKKTLRCVYSLAPLPHTHALNTHTEFALASTHTNSMHTATIVFRKLDLN